MGELGQSNAPTPSGLAGLEPDPPYAPHFSCYDATSYDLKHAWLVHKYYIYLPLALRDY